MTAAPPPPPETGLHGRPTADELLEAVQEFLRDVLAPVVGDEYRYHLRVAVNVLEIVRREQRLGSGQEAAHRAGLAALGVADAGELARALRVGVPLDEKAVRAAISADVRARLAVANPSYASPAPAAPRPDAASGGRRGARTGAGTEGTSGSRRDCEV